MAKRYWFRSLSRRVSWKSASCVRGEQEATTSLPSRQRTRLHTYPLFSPRGQLFDAAQAIGAGDGEVAEGDGICWIATPADGGVPRFLLRTKFGLEEIATLEHLQLRLGLVAPGPPPENDAARGALPRIV